MVTYKKNKRRHRQVRWSAGKPVKIGGIASEKCDPELREQDLAVKEVNWRCQAEFVLGAKLKLHAHQLFSMPVFSPVIFSCSLVI